MSVACSRNSMAGDKIRETGRQQTTQLCFHKDKISYLINSSAFRNILISWVESAKDQMGKVLLV